jgi:CheY-like chemotaxis protein
MNLAVNARDAMEGGGSLEIETGRERVELQHPHGSFRPGDYVVLRVSDTGHGMDEETRRHVFDPFFTTKEVGKGTGLGLATVYGIIEQSGGYVEVESEPGRGTTFRVWLPERTGPWAEPGAGAAGAADGTRTVLLVEDEDAVRGLARRVLERRGYRVLEAASAPEALERAAAEDGVIDLLLTDVVMPGPSGRDLAERVLQIRPSTRVLYMSGYTEDEIIRRGVLGEGTAFLEKPFTPDALERKIREVLEA